MASGPLLFDATTDLAITAVYWWAGSRLWKRHVSESVLPAWRMLTLWWFALGATGLLAGFASLLAAVGVTDLPAFVFLQHVQALSFCVAMVGLGYYLLYFVTGRGMLIPLTVLYSGFFVLLVYVVIAGDPQALDASGWRPRIVFANTLHPAIGLWPSVILLLAPQSAFALLYLALWPRVKDRTLRYRIALIASSIALWTIGVAFIARSELSQSVPVQVAARLLVLGSALTMLLAYQPPAWVRRRLGVRGVADPPVVPPA